MAGLVDDPISFLHTVRKSYWRGQSYDEMYDQLACLLATKLYAERTQSPFTAATVPQLWYAATAHYGLPADAFVTSYPDDRLDRAIDTIARWQIGTNKCLWHVMHRAWLRHHSKRDDGQYYTPEFIKRFMVSICPPRPGHTICDPCGGSAGFILEAADHLPVIDPSLFYYFDIDGGQTIRSARMILSMYSHSSGISLSTLNMERRDSLAGPWPRQMDRIYTNVPFGVRITRRTRHNNQPLLDQFRTGYKKVSELSQVLFIEQCLQQLTPTGCFATVVDKGIVTNDKLRPVRQKLLHTPTGPAGYLRLIVELPSVAFEYVAGTTYPTYLLFFTAERCERTQFARITNPGYDGSGYVIDNQHLSGFPIEEDDRAWTKSDWPVVLAQYAAGTLPTAAHADLLTGDWHYGLHKYKSYAGERLGDLADVVQVDWPGINKLNPTVDRRYHILIETHLNPQRKTLALQRGCIFMSKLVSDDYRPRCALVTAPFVGAGCTNENYIIKPHCDRDLVRLWYLINFNADTHEYLRSNARGQGRGRILMADLLQLPILPVPAAFIKIAARLLRRLIEKTSSDHCLLGELAELSSLIPPS